ncbi:hypothetical protein I6E74_13855 [Salinibacterium sp. SWN139]|uniref:hypothetical protein n=1 Tax=Salinibacterium sp. SWN139 TaxID=2792055 RepID=UPI0018CD2E0B|nr:hypothetical protein [Salinibacterium sp. SWN139]MBH0055252.1 hypothetical protein [Salinibacterium sp. SWN139]
MLRSIDYSGLIYPVTPHAVAEFKANRRGLFGYSQAHLVGRVLMVGFIIVAFISFAGVPFALIVAHDFRSAAQTGNIAQVAPMLIIAGLVIAVAAGALFTVVRAWRKDGGPWKRFYRMNKFAEDNDLAFSPKDLGAEYPGLIFGQGGNQSIRDRFRSASGRALDYGNYQYTTGSGKNRRTYDWGFLAFELDRALPHMVLDATRNNQFFGMSNLPQTFAKNQVLTLEGDFNSHFTLYCPREYERDALYIFTPDLMALLIDNVAAYDVEVVDKWLLVYSPKPFDLVDPAQHRRLLGIADTVGTKTVRQSRRYADETIGDYSVNLVAPRGQRLKAGIPAATLVMVALFAAVWGIPFVLGMFT